MVERTGHAVTVLRVWSVGVDPTSLAEQLTQPRSEGARHGVRQHLTLRAYSCHASGDRFGILIRRILGADLPNTTRAFTGGRCLLDSALRGWLLGAPCLSACSPCYFRHGHGELRFHCGWSPWCSCTAVTVAGFVRFQRVFELQFLPDSATTLCVNRKTSLPVSD